MAGTDAVPGLGRRRALLVTPDYAPLRGGIARLLNSLVHNTADEVEWRVLTTARGPEQHGVVRSSTLSGLLGRVPFDAAWLRRGVDPLVVCGHLYVLGPALLSASLGRARLGTLVYGKELIPRRPRHRAVLQLLRASGRVVAISDHSASIARALGVDPRRVAVANPVGAPAWPMLPTPRRRGDERLRLVTIGRMTEGYKNFELLLRLTSVLSLGKAPVMLTIIGDGPRRKALEQKAKMLGVQTLVEFAGEIEDEDIPTVLAHAHIGVFPSRASLAEGGFEGFGLVIHELASAALPVIVGRAGGATDAAGAGWSVLVDPDDLRAWAQAVEALATDEARRFGMATAAATWASQIDAVGGAHRLFEALAE